MCTVRHGWPEGSCGPSDNSSNTCNLARICADRVATYHIAEPGCVAPDEIRHRPIGGPSTAATAERATRGWLPAGNLMIGLTAGASTPNSLVGQVIEKLEVLGLGTP